MTAKAPVSLVNAYTGRPKGALYEHWREEICRGFFRLEIDAGADGTIDMRAEIANLQPTAIAIAKGASAVISRSDITNNDGVDDFAFVCNPQNTMRFHYKDETLEIPQGGVCLSDMAVRAGGTLGACREFTTLRIARKTLLAAAPKAEDQLFKPKNLPPELSELIGRYAALAVRAAPHVQAQGRFLMGQHLVDLVALALGAGPDDTQVARRRGQVQARLSLMKADILAALHRNDMSIGEIARRYKLSARQAQRLFEQEGITFTEFLLKQRLLLAHKLLLNPANQWRKISDIAYSAGFSDLSYFNRAFQRRFGCTPSEVRANCGDVDQ